MIKPTADAQYLKTQPFIAAQLVASCSILFTIYLLDFFSIEFDCSLWLLPYDNRGQWGI